MFLRQRTLRKSIAAGRILLRGYGKMIGPKEGEMFFFFLMKQFSTEHSLDCTSTYRSLKHRGSRKPSIKSSTTT